MDDLVWSHPAVGAIGIDGDDRSCFFATKPRELLANAYKLDLAESPLLTALANLRYDRHPSGRVLVSALWEELGTGDRPSVAWPEVRRHK